MNSIEHDVKQIRSDRTSVELELREMIPVYAEQVHQMQALYGREQDNRELKQEQRLMLALGMALISGTQSAVEWTVTRCLNHGVTNKQIHEIIELALLNGGTFVVANARFAHNVTKVKPEGSKP